MQKKYRNFLQSLFFSCCIAVLAYGVDRSFLGQMIDAYLVQPLDFRIRLKLGRAPKLDPRILILAFDDHLSSQIHKSDFDFKDWLILLEAIAQTKPRLLMIDKIFGAPIGEFSLEEAVRRLQSLSVPMVTLAKVSSIKLGLQSPIPFDPKHFAQNFWERRSETLDWVKDGNA